jgi:methionyl-tRNA synthetase
VADLKTYYITTPIYYANDAPHIGHAYTTAIADTVARFMRLTGREVFFATGTDEHAEKVMAAAERAGLPIGEFAEKLAEQYREAWARLDITYDDFIRTPEPRHRHAVEEVLRRLLATGDIYKGEYEGWYCPRCATFFSDSEIVEGKCPAFECEGNPVEKRGQPAYFFRASAYADRVLAHIEANPEFIRPEMRKNEVIGFIRSGLRDTCISRPSNGWGIPVPGDESHQVYVWFDALINYLTVAGWPDDTERFERLWPPDLQVMAKDILPRFHGSLWPAMLMALGLPLPKAIVAHGYWLSKDRKISKSSGGLVSADDLAAELQELVPIQRDIACDAIRHFYLREMQFGQDADFSREALWGRLNADLANDLGNVLNRSLPLIERNFGGVVPEGTVDPTILAACEALATSVPERIAACDFRGAVDAIWEVIAALNKYLDTQAPWSAVKAEDKQPARDCLLTTCEAIRRLSVAVLSFLPHAAMEIRRQLGLAETPEGLFAAELTGPPCMAGVTIQRGDPIFPRVKIPKPKPLEEPAPKPVEANTEAPPTVSYEDFRKLDLRVGTVLSAEKVEGADKLLKLQVDLGTEVRQIVAGIALVFPPEEMTGKRIVVVANLAPAKIRGVESQGMLLASGDGGPTGLVTIDRPVGNGERIR